MLVVCGHAFADNGLYPSQHLYIPRHSRKRFSSFFFLAGLWKVITHLSRGPILAVACSLMSSESYPFFFLFACVRFSDLLTYKPNFFQSSITIIHKISNVYVSVWSFHSWRDILPTLYTSACVVFRFCVFLVISKKASKCYLSFVMRTATSNERNVFGIVSLRWIRACNKFRSRSRLLPTSFVSNRV